MSMAEIEAFQGLQLNRNLQIVNLDGSYAQNIYTALSTLSAAVWEGQNQATIFTPAVSWYTAGNTQTGYTQGQVALSIIGSQTTGLDPAGEYYLLISETTNGITAPVIQARLKILATPGSTTSSPPDLITLDYAMSALSEVTLSDTQRDFIPYLVSAASQAVRRFCKDRNFDQRTYAEFHDIALNGQIRLLQPPVQIVNRVQGPTQLALTVSNSTAQFAQALFAYTGTWDGYSANAQTATGIILNWTTNGTANTTTIAYTTGMTVAALATAINAVGNGWLATPYDTTNIGLWPVTELDGGWVAQGCGMYATPSTGAYFNILQDLAISDFRLDTRRAGFLTVGRQYGWSDAQRWGPGGDMFFDGQQQGGWLGRSKITYVGGTMTIPPDVQHWTAQLVKWKFELIKQELLLKGETAGEYSYNLAPEMVSDMPISVRRGLSPWRLHYA